ncbi:hypothetical protein A1O7_03996 [Cladophialophora yegresii CBS 114405]|uniref:Uncharacterized protein n=1 Tax=Cladophialophora yegresii CBS 114405 TaxID=1182544 RepID=W9WN74_9EURO|nr:uncharacterized protein A1O7_03996 [Cladophialophora yegresii CBS 114405]EXJ59849.1 hypothetical protein A1O7_03996 [Cladophialophora yegresii CBS 114405]
MFAATETHVNGAPEILDGAQHSAPRSWNNVRRWRVLKNQPSAKHNEQGRSDTGLPSTGASENCTTNYNGYQRSRRSQPTALTAFRHAIVFLAFSLPVVALALVVKVPQWYAFEAEHWVSNSFTHCNFNGEFTPLDKPTLGVWDPAGFFYITVSWGKMAFSTAKFIDIVWDMAVGRGGQALLAFVTFKVSSQYLALAMLKAPVSYNTFESLAFVPPTLVRTVRLAGDLLTNRGWRARLIMVWIISSSLFVLGFSSLVTAMSGYSSNINAVMPNLENESVLWSNFQVVQFAVNDAQRIGHPGPLFVTTGDICVQDGFHDDDDDDDDSGKYYNKEYLTAEYPPSRRAAADENEDGNADGTGEVPWEYVPANCTTFWHIVQYVSTYGLQGKIHTESTITFNGTTHKLAPPALNVTTSYSPTALSTLSTYLNTFSMSSPPAPSSLSSVTQLTDNTFWVYDDETYTFSYVLDNATCRYSKWHNWGFSFLFLFITSLLLAIWSVGTYALWLYTHLHNSQDHESRLNSTGGIYRSSFTLVEAMKRDVGPGAVTPELKECEIRSLVSRRRGRVIHGVGNIDAGPSPILCEPEKNLITSPSTTSPINQFPTSRWRALRSWMSPPTHPRPSHADESQSSANSVFTLANSTFSSTSQHPILHSPAAPGRTMTMTSRMSSLASPLTESPPEFGYSPATQAGILDETTDVRNNDPSETRISGRPRPRLSLSRAIRVSTQDGTNPRTGTAPLLSASSSLAPKWVSSPGPVTPSDDSGSTVSPIPEDTSYEDAVRWKNDLGED